MCLGGEVRPQVCTHPSAAQNAKLMKYKESFSLSSVICEAPLGKTPTRRTRVGIGCTRISRTAGRSGCTPAEPYPPNRTHTVLRKPKSSKFRRVPVDKPIPAFLRLCIRIRVHPCASVVGSHSFASIFLPPLGLRFSAPYYKGSSCSRAVKGF